MKPTDIESLAFERQQGLLPAIVQHALSGAVLMLGYMDRAALSETLSRRRVVFFSRSRQRLWEKGESSGHALDVQEVLTDCDRDTLLVLALPRGPVCHTGTLTCFGDEARSAAERLAFLESLAATIDQRIAQPSAGSYTARLFAEGPRRIAQKVGEEALEVALAAVSQGERELLGESADLLFHLLVLLKSRGLSLHAVVDELQSRHTSG